MTGRDYQRCAGLTGRQPEMLRLVFEHYKTPAIAHELGLSAKYVDNQLIEAKNIIGAPSRFEAARQFMAYEAGVGKTHPVENPSSPTPLWPLPLPVPTSETPANMLRWNQVTAWVWIIAIATPIGMTTAAMAIVALMLVFGMKPT